MPTGIYRRAWRVCLLLLGIAGCSGAHAPGPGEIAPARDRVRAESLNQSGLELIAQAEWTRAEALFRSALEADPFHGPAHCNLGVALWKQDRYFDAGWELRYACQLMPKAAQPRLNLGLLYESVGRSQSAEEHFREALSCAPDDVEVIGHLARVRVRRNELDSSTHDWLQVVATSDDDPAWRDWAQRCLALFPSKALPSPSGDTP